MITYFTEDSSPDLKGLRILAYNISTMISQHWGIHDDVIKWKHFPRYWPFVRGIHRSPVNSTHKGQWRKALMFSLICAWINGWANNGEAGDLGRHCAHYDVTVMLAIDCGRTKSDFVPKKVVWRTSYAMGSFLSPDPKSILKCWGISLVNVNRRSDFLRKL